MPKTQHTACAGCRSGSAQNLMEYLGDRLCYYTLLLWINFTTSLQMRMSTCVSLNVSIMTVLMKLWDDIVFQSLVRHLDIYSYICSPKTCSETFGGLRDTMYSNVWTSFTNGPSKLLKMQIMKKRDNPYENKIIGSSTMVFDNMFRSGLHCYITIPTFMFAFIFQKVNSFEESSELTLMEMLAIKKINSSFVHYSLLILCGILWQL